MEIAGIPHYQIVIVTVQSRVPLAGIRNMDENIGVFRPVHIGHCIADTDRVCILFARHRDDVALDRFAGSAVVMINRVVFRSAAYRCFGAVSLLQDDIRIGKTPVHLELVCSAASKLSRFKRIVANNDIILVALVQFQRAGSRIIDPDAEIRIFHFTLEDFRLSVMNNYRSSIICDVHCHVVAVK